MDGKDQIIKTLLYFDIFSYPLEESEIWYFLQGRKIRKKNFKRLLKDKRISKIKSLYFLRASRSAVQERRKREKVSEDKIRIATKVISKLKLVPTVKFIGISGSLAMKNSKTEDDIDIFVVSNNGHVWTTRFFLVLLLNILGVYRNSKDKDYSNKFCLNFIIGENRISLQSERQNLYSAHEIVQLFPVFQRGNTYSKLIDKNKWINYFLPNYVDKIKQIKVQNTRTTFSDKVIVFILNLLRVEKIAKFIQRMYMRGKITQEEIADDFLAFHPKDYKNLVLSKLEKRYKEYKLI